MFLYIFVDVTEDTKPKQKYVLSNKYYNIRLAEKLLSFHKEIIDSITESSNFFANDAQIQKSTV